MIYRLLADAVLVLHLTFIVFVVASGLFLLCWSRRSWLHLPALSWGVTIEQRGYICPLAPQENRLRQFGGEAGDVEGFVKHDLLPVIYPVGLTREWPNALGLGVASFVDFLLHEGTMQVLGANTHSPMTKATQK
jgi:hypothetical protein